mgnify:CR=1 FL=1
MSKNLGPVCRLCRREGEKLYDSALVISPAGKIIERYHKIQLAERWPDAGEQLSVFKVAAAYRPDEFSIRVDKHFAAHMARGGANALHHSAQGSGFVVLFDFREGLINTIHGSILPLESPEHISK